ncbi:MAG: putative PEP-binding protein, partial [Pseudomonadota bacterium]
MQKLCPNITMVTPDAPIAANTHGGRAKCLQRLVRLDMPVPGTVALSFDTVAAIASGDTPDMTKLMAPFGTAPILCVRPSSQDPDWGGPRALLNIGMNDERYAELSQEIGQEAAASLYQRFVQSYAVHVARVDADLFDDCGDHPEEALRCALAAYEEEIEEPFPQDAEVQLLEVLRSMARAWQGTSARLLRQAKGAPVDAGLGLIVQKMALGLGHGECGSGVMQLVDGVTGERRCTGRYQSQSQGREALAGGKEAMFLQKDARGPSLEDLAPDEFAKLKEYTQLMRDRLREELQAEFTIMNGKVFILDGVKVSRSARGAVSIAVALAEDGIISREEAILRIEPRSLNELLHRQIDPEAPRDVLARGIGASPGAAAGTIVFTAEEAQAADARDEACILVRRETNPEDIRGMHSAAGVLTEKGGITSHAAVIGRGIGKPCVVGASDISFQPKEQQLVFPDGRVFKAGDMITIDGSNGQVLAGEAPTLQAARDDAFKTLMIWADEHRDIDVRANADTPADAKVARTFKAQGIGLCRTEHMFVEPDRLTAMREMIFADTSDDRASALEILLPMQRADFIELFRIMQGHPVCIRLLDPPLHEYLPSDRRGIRELADALDLPVADVTLRVEALGEYNPMLGMRGVRLGIAIPEIYAMQARAIFEATLEARREGIQALPE